jgi:hypothetical protein
MRYDVIDHRDLEMELKSPFYGEKTTDELLILLLNIKFTEFVFGKIRCPIIRSNAYR